MPPCHPVEEKRDVGRGDQRRAVKFVGTTRRLEGKAGLPFYVSCKAKALPYELPKERVGDACDASLQKKTYFIFLNFLDLKFFLLKILVHWSD
jgi:hypothetical protein